MRLASRLPSVFTAAPRVAPSAPWKVLSASQTPSQIHVRILPPLIKLRSSSSSRLSLQNQLSPSLSPRRQLSQSPPTFSSPFRLSSNNGPAEHNPSSSPEFETNDPNDPLSHYSQYKPKRQWPPDMSKLSPKHQFRLERKYRRRAALKFARPKWMKATKLVQWGVIGCKLLETAFLGDFMVWED